MEYPHIKFNTHWTIGPHVIYRLGQCEAIIQSVNNMPLLPTVHKQLLRLSFTKGAIATTAIEGNTLTVEQWDEIYSGKELPKSKEYLKTEVQNIINGYNEILEKLVVDDKEELITPDLIKRFHRYVGADLGENFEAIPGEFRRTNVTVGGYKAPNFEDVPELINKFCEWLLEEFHYIEGQNFIDAIIQAIVSHVYIEWIHPFGDGNGRTGRMLEMYLLLRAGNPDLSSHILSNYYNDTRSMYYKHLNNSTKKGDLTEFIEYAVEGFYEGLVETLKTIQLNIFEISWRKYVYDVFKQITYTKREPFRRKRELFLQLPLNRKLTVEEIMSHNVNIMKAYSKLNDRTLLRDLQLGLDKDLLFKPDDKHYQVNTTKLLSENTIAQRRSKVKRIDKILI